MTQPINLNKARKARAKAHRKAQAAQNAVTFGRTKAQKDADRAETARKTAMLDAHKRGPSEP